MTPSPTPSDDLPALGVDGVIVLAVLGVVCIVLVLSLLRSANLEPPAMMAVALSVLTLVALGAYLFIQKDALLTLAATGFGALAGALSHLFESREQHDRRVDKGKHSDDSA